MFNFLSYKDANFSNARLANETGPFLSPIFKILVLLSDLINFLVLYSRL